MIKAVDPDNEMLYLYLPFQSVHAPLEVRTKSIIKKLCSLSVLIAWYISFAVHSTYNDYKVHTRTMQHIQVYSEEKV